MTRATIYWLGGSPCAGKSSVAEMLTKKHKLTYYQVDDHFKRHLNQTDLHNHPACTALKAMSPNQVWMADVKTQVEREWLIYREMFDFILADLMPLKRPILVEGAGCLPEMVSPFLALGQRGAWMIPTEKFFRHYYAKREWAPHIVKDCSDPQQAYENWMNRDIEFSKRINQQTNDLCLPILIVDGKQSIQENAAWVERQFGL